MIIIDDWKKELRKYEDINYALHCIDLENRVIEQDPVLAKALEAAKNEADFEHLLNAAKKQKQILHSRDLDIFTRHLYALKVNTKTQRLRYQTAHPDIGYYANHLQHDVLEFNRHLQMLGFAEKNPTQTQINELAKSHLVHHYKAAQHALTYGKSDFLRDGIINGHLIAMATFGSYCGHPISWDKLIAFSQAGVELEYAVLERYLK